jgi:S-DNA-T family DNA segregation ATPase FtsK/SpoIIIE
VNKKEEQAFSLLSCIGGDILRKLWRMPGGLASVICLDMLKQAHLLIAGTTGSGKSVLINSLIYTALYKSPNRCQFILIDPKRVELIDYKPLPHTISYSSELPNILDALQYSVELMEKRYKQMQRQRIKKSNAANIYIIIDEYADLVIQAKKQVERCVIRLSQLGRAANIHLILATQRPTRDIVTGAIKVNLDSRVALHCSTAQDSRNILDIKGAETLPRYGYGYYRTPEGLKLICIPMTNPKELAARVKWWTDQKGIFSFLHRPG